MATTPDVFKALALRMLGNPSINIDEAALSSGCDVKDNEFYKCEKSNAVATVARDLKSFVGAGLLTSVTLSMFDIDLHTNRYQCIDSDGIILGETTNIRLDETERSLDVVLDAITSNVLSGCGVYVFRMFEPKHAGYLVVVDVGSSVHLVIDSPLRKFLNVLAMCAGVYVEDEIVRNEMRLSFLHYDMDDLGCLDDWEMQKTDLCWLSATISYLQSYYYMTYGERILLSKQEMLDKCKPSAPVGTSYGFSAPQALEWVHRDGICEKSHYSLEPFTGLKQEPKPKQPGALVLRIGEVYLHKNPSDSMILTKFTSAPVCASVAKIPLTRSRKLHRVPYVMKNNSVIRGFHTVCLKGFDTSLYNCLCFAVRDFGRDWRIQMIKANRSLGHDERSPIRHVAFTKYICRLEKFTGPY